MHRSSLIVLAALALLATGTDTGDRNEGDEQEAESIQATGETKASTRPQSGDETKIEFPEFKPRPSPKWTAHSGTRGGRKRHPQWAAKLRAIVPEGGGGLTLKAQPSLYWHLSEPISGELSVTVWREDGEGDALEATHQGAFEVGINRVDLANFDFGLTPGETYTWWIDIAVDGREQDVSSAPGGRLSLGPVGGKVRRLSPRAELRTELDQAPEERLPFILAREGIWYDAVDLTTRRLEASPGDEDAVSQQGALLSHVAP